MKLNDVTKTDDEALYEALDTDNQSGVGTDTLVKMVNSHKSDNWQSVTSVKDAIDVMRNYRKNMVK